MKIRVQRRSLLLLFLLLEMVLGTMLYQRATLLCWWQEGKIRRQTDRQIAAELPAYAAVARAVAASRAAVAAPNVIIVSIDTLRADQLPFYGSRSALPNLESLQHDGILFRRAFSVAPWTTPSHMSLFTSLYPEQHRVSQMVNRKTALPAGVKTLAAVLREHGYATVGFTGGANVGRAHGFANGFDRYDETDFLREHRRHDPLFTWLAAPPPGPFLLFFHSYLCHDPYQPPVAFVAEQYCGRYQQLLAAMKDAAGNDELKRREIFWQNISRDNPADLQFVHALYEANIRCLDSFMGEFLAALKLRGLYDSSLIVFTSDHGEEFMEHGGFMHEQLYRETLEIPLLLKLPGQANAGSLLTTPVQNIDIMPTLLAYLGIAHSPMAGIDMLAAPPFAGQPRMIFSQNEVGDRAYRYAERTWVFAETRRPEFYLRENDPRELAMVKRPPRGEQLVLERWKTAFDRLLARVRITPVAIDPAALDRNKLRALGYLN